MLIFWSQLLCSAAAVNLCVLLIPYSINYDIYSFLTFNLKVKGDPDSQDYGYDMV